MVIRMLYNEKKSTSAATLMLNEKLGIRHNLEDIIQYGQKIINLFMKYRKSCGEVGVTPQLFTYGKLLRSMDEVKPRSCSMAQ